eukprot:1334957-Amorphochlora_amoeboformis.AAC.1
MITIALSVMDRRRRRADEIVENPLLTTLTTHTGDTNKYLSAARGVWEGRVGSTRIGDDDGEGPSNPQWMERDSLNPQWMERDSLSA